MSTDTQGPVPTYYQILQLPQNGRPIDPVQLKTAYRRALLNHHPDKKYLFTPTSAVAGFLEQASTSDRVSVFSVDEIIKAYKTLSSATEKAKYDGFLETQTCLKIPHNGEAKTNYHHAGVETYELDELFYDEENESWSRKCRCGDEVAYTVTEADLERESEHREIYVGCKGCSLSIRVLFAPA